MALTLAAFGLLSDGQARANPALIGEWEPVITAVPVPAVHSIMLHTGDVLFFRGDGTDDDAEDVMTYKWNPETGTIEALPPLVDHFCSGHSFLPDGRVLVTGGQGEPSLGATHIEIYDPVTEQWSTAPSMREGRWYPTNVPQADGTTLIIAGKNEINGDNPEVERFVPGGGVGGADLLEYVVGADQTMELYPRLHLLASGKVMRVGQEPETMIFDPVLKTWQTIATSNFGWRYEGTSVQLPPGQDRFMILGGWAPTGGLFATDTVEIIDLSDSVPAWSYTTPLHNRRMDANAVILPDAKVFVAGGAEDPNETIQVSVAEMFDPVAETWTEMATQGSFRDYHSSAVLLPSGKVMWGGSDNNPTMQVYAPPYLFQGPRPTVAAVPASVDYSATFQVTTPEAPTIAKVVFMRPGATTHSVNMEQRYVPLSFSQLNPTTLEVIAPASGHVAPPGFYMMFLVDSNGVPSEAPFVRLGVALAPRVFAGVDQTVTLPLDANLDATVFGFNGPTGLVSTWSKLSGPGTVIFGDANALETTASFSAAGSHVLRLTVVDGAFNVTSDVTITVAGSATATTFDLPIATNADDVEEFFDGHINFNSGDLELLEHAIPHLGVGLRFDAVDLPQGAEIFEAWIQFEASEQDTAPTLLNIQAEATDDAPIFSKATNDVTNRTRTAASASWAPGPWTANGEQGPKQRTAGWASGNAIAFVITGNGERVVESFDTDPASAAILHVKHGGPQDSDSDTVLDGIDNCVLVPNPLQDDYDVDGFGDLCDDDDDGDGLLDIVETMTGTYIDPSQTGTDPMNADSDGDGIDDGFEVLDRGTDPNVANVDPSNPPGGVAASCAFNVFAIVDVLGEFDRYNVSAIPGDIINVDVDADEISSPLDSSVRIVNGSGVEVASNDDAAAPGESSSKDSYLTTTIVTAGIYSIEVSSSGNATTGPYLLELSGNCQPPPPASVPTISPAWLTLLASLMMLTGYRVLRARA